jgi:hypothetical protein
MVFILPMFESIFRFSNSLAAAAADPRRYVLFYFPSGTYNRPNQAQAPIWMTPNTGAISAANTSLALSPFAANYADITSINYLKNNSFDTQMDPLYADEHQGQAASYLTCAQASAVGTMTSFENVLAKAFNKPAFVLSGGVTEADHPVDGYISYLNGVPNGGISNPGVLYAQLLKQVVPTATPSPGASPVGQSVLDSSIQDFAALSAKLGTADQKKLNEFLTSIRDLETSLSMTTTVSATGNAACVTPTISPTVNNGNSQDSALYYAKFQAFNDLIKIAFACDITRSVSIMMDTETSERAFSNAPPGLVYNGQDIAGGFSDHIGISHGSGLTAQGYNLAVTRDRMLFSLVIDLVNKLKASKDASGSTMLANTIIQAGYGVEDGNHSLFINQRPLIIAGGTNMINNGLSYSYANNDFKDLYYTIATKLGANIGGNFQGSTTLLTL